MGYAFLHTFLAAGYVAVVARIMSNAKYILGPMPEFVLATAFLLLFVTSAAVMGAIVFGRPILWYLAGRKKEAVQLAVGTIAFMVLLVSGVIGGLVFLNF